VRAPRMDDEEQRPSVEPNGIVDHILRKR
jgi:hypothetical protein